MDSVHVDLQLTLGLTDEVSLLLNVVHVVGHERGLDGLLDMGVGEDRLLDKASEFVLGYTGGQRTNLVADFMVEVGDQRLSDIIVETSGGGSRGIGDLVEDVVDAEED